MMPKSLNEFDKSGNLEVKESYNGNKIFQQKRGPNFLHYRSIQYTTMQLNIFPL
jgi:hypothetical protein